MAGHVSNPATKFEAHTNIRPWVTSYNVSHWLPLKMYLKCVRRPFCFMQIIRWKLKIRLGNRAHCIQHAWIMLKSLVPHFYPKMHLTCTILRNASRLSAHLVVPDKGPLNGCVSVCCIRYLRFAIKMPVYSVKNDGSSHLYYITVLNISVFLTAFLTTW